MVEVQNFMEWILKGLVGGVIFLGGWVMKRLHSRVDEVEKDQRKLALLLAKDYPSRHELSESLKDLKEWLIKIDAKLDGKADK